MSLLENACKSVLPWGMHAPWKEGDHSCSVKKTGTQVLDGKTCILACVFKSTMALTEKAFAEKTGYHFAQNHFDYLLEPPFGRTHGLQKALRVIAMWFSDWFFASAKKKHFFGFLDSSTYDCGWEVVAWCAKQTGPFVPNTAQPCKWNRLRHWPTEVVTSISLILLARADKICLLKRVIIQWSSSQFLQKVMLSCKAIVDSQRKSLKQRE